MLSNSLLKSKFLARFGPGRAGLGVLVRQVNASKNNRIFSDIDGIKRSISHSSVGAAPATPYTILAKDSGKTFVFGSATTTVLTLPLAAEGLRFSFINKVIASSGAGHTITVPVGASMYAKGITAADGKGLVNTQATGAIGDYAEFRSDGTDWFATVLGTWARVA